MPLIQSVTVLFFLSGFEFVDGLKGLVLLGPTYLTGHFLYPWVNTHLSLYPFAVVDHNGPFWVLFILVYTFFLLWSVFRKYNIPFPCYADDIQIYFPFKLYASALLKPQLLFMKNVLLQISLLVFFVLLLLHSVSCPPLPRILECF